MTRISPNISRSSILPSVSISLRNEACNETKCRVREVRLGKIVILILLSMAFISCELVAQTQATVAEGPPLSRLDNLAAGGSLNRSEYIAGLLNITGLDQLHAPFPATFAKRFAAAEERVERGKQSATSELRVAMGFNRLSEMRGSSARTTVEAVHQLRLSLATFAPHLITVGSSPSECRPGESLFLLYFLDSGNGMGFAVHSSLRLIPDQIVSKLATNEGHIGAIKKLEAVLSLLRL
jgi:hypothetical protein